nr:nitrite reductase large subunit NirB [uncultured Carboxylicivirga sp.]
MRPRDELARAAGLQVGERGGIVVTPDTLTNDPSIFAIGECALIHNMIWGLVAPCYEMADVAVRKIAGEEAAFSPADMSTKLKLIGVDVASFGEVFGNEDQREELVYQNKSTGNYKKLFVSKDGKYLLGGILVGDASDYNMLFQLYNNKMKLPENLDNLLFTGTGGGFELSVLDLPDDAVICSCENITKGNIVSAIEEGELTNVGQIKKCTKAGTGCGGCAPMLSDLMDAVLKASGKEVKKVICEHFAYTRQELFDLIKVGSITTFNELIHKHGHGRGCEICKPLAGSLLASIHNSPVPKHDVIQDTNDRFLANIQRGGSYSVVPRIPGGEITPDKLIVLGEVAKKYDLYTKITGGQRIDMFGAKVHELPMIWEELIAAGFESGHAYGKSLRTVKSCVGSTWCRYGQQDSVSFAIEIENRYKGLRSPHKLKGGVSGCIRECAEARGKDFGIIATEKGFNLYVCGNGGANPVHAVLLATDVDKETCVKYLDRFLMYYIKTAGPLTRTAKWLTQMEGGIEHVKEVVINDSLGIADDLEKDMQAIVDTYVCEWKLVVEDPVLRKGYRHFINSEEDGSSLKFIPMRDQKRPDDWAAEPQQQTVESN